MKKSNLALFLPVLLASACSDDTSSPQPDPVTPPSSVSEYSTIDVTPKAMFDGTVTAYLGRFEDKYRNWRLSPEAIDVNNDGHVDEEDALELGILNDLGTPIVIDAKKMDTVLQTNPDGLGAGTARPDIFVDGHYSAFDVLRYLAVTRSDIKLENIVPYEETGLDTYQFTVSWDQNGDGIFDSQDANSFNSSDWHFKFKFDGGEKRRVTASLDGIAPDGESNYMRMDQFWVQPGMNLRFQPFIKEFMARKNWVMLQETERLKANGGKVIVAEVISSTDYGATYETILENLEVTAHNLRPDIFKPGVITKIDILLSATDAGHEFVINYWPTLSTKSPVGHFALFSVNGKDSVVGEGWITDFGEKDAETDFAPFAKCDFGADGTPDGLPKVSHDACWSEWNYYFGGNMVHLMTDVWVMNQPSEVARIAYKSHYTIWEMEDFNGNKIQERDFSQDEDGSDIAVLRTLSLPDEATSTLPILKESHFGWGIADCESCHNDTDPKGHGGYSWPVNSVDGFNEIQPHYCASCHGSNGAPVGHQETARCYWCHSEDQQPKNHGEASTKHWITGAENLEGNLHSYPKAGSAITRDKNGNFAPYTEILSATNSDWNMSKAFPDPYSCMTCHPNAE